METGQFLMELLRGVSGNTNVITELRRVVDNLPVRSEFKDNSADIKAELAKISARLDKIDAWQKIKLPFIIGTITLVLYAIGFFFTMQEVNGMFLERQTPAIVERIK